MYKIIKAEKLNEIVYLMVVEAPMVAKHCQPGQRTMQESVFL